jgi:hypothetical protein
VGFVPRRQFSLRRRAPAKAAQWFALRSSILWVFSMPDPMGMHFARV